MAKDIRAELYFEALIGKCWRDGHDPSIEYEKIKSVCVEFLNQGCAYDSSFPREIASNEGDLTCRRELLSFGDNFGSGFGVAPCEVDARWIVGGETEYCGLANARGACFKSGRVRTIGSRTDLPPVMNATLPDRSGISFFGSNVMVGAILLSSKMAR